MSLRQKRQITLTFRHHNLSLQPAALHGLLNILHHSPSSPSPHTRTPNTTLLTILTEIKQRLLKNDPGPGGSLVVSKEMLEEVVADMTRDEGDVVGEALQLLVAGEMGRLEWDGVGRRWGLVGGGGFWGRGRDKVEMFTQRYALIHQRMLRQEHFRPNLVGVSRLKGGGGEEGEEDGGRTKITPIEGLLGRSGVKILLGMVCQVEEGQYYLEDPTGQIPISLTNTTPLTTGFLTETSIVLVEGTVDDDHILQVHKIGHPIFEPRRNAVDAIGLRETDIFRAIPNLGELSKLRVMEEEYGREGSFVILSDVHLDDGRVMLKMERLLEGFDECEVLPVFVLLGNFVSGKGAPSKATIVGYYDGLANLISKFPRIAEEGRFILVPGPEDVGLGSIVPRLPLPGYVTGGLRKKVRHVHFGSNPCRIRYFSREFVVGRLDVLNRLRRSSILLPKEFDVDGGNDDDGSGSEDDGNAAMDEDDNTTTTNTPSLQPSQPTMQSLIQHGVKTMLDQGHICPVPLTELPVYWQYDHALRLYPPPDVLVVGDSAASRYSENYGDVDVMNPGSFYRDFGFLVYRPFGDEVDDGSGMVRSEVDISVVED